MERPELGGTVVNGRLNELAGPDRGECCREQLLAHRVGGVELPIGERAIDVGQTDDRSIVLDVLPREHHVAVAEPLNHDALLIEGSSPSRGSLGTTLRCERRDESNERRRLREVALRSGER
jgi:hypothetical protein